MITAPEIKKMLEAGLPGADVSVEDLTGTFDHYKAVIVSEAFNGKRLVMRHQMINEILKEPLKGPIHALTLETHTPAELAAKQL